MSTPSPAPTPAAASSRSTVAQPRADLPLPASLAAPRGLVLPTRATVGGIATFGFAAAALMWVGGFVMHIPVSHGDWSETYSVGVFLVLLVGLLMMAGFAGYAMRPALRAGVGTGVTASLINVLVLSGLLSGDSREEMMASMAQVLGGSLLIGVVVGAIGGLAGGAYRRYRDRRMDAAGAPAQGAEPEGGGSWLGAFAVVATITTLFMLGLGGAVTSAEAGLSVSDWPSTEGELMVLYPLSKMTGGIYYEHAHRLFGLLVGLTTMALAVFAWRVPRGKRVRRLVIAAVALVILQGVLGGMRVADSDLAGLDAVELAVASAETVDKALAYAVAHGVLAQGFFALLVVIAAMTASRWGTIRAELRPATVESFGPMRKQAYQLSGALLLQILLGAVLRHYGGHMIWAHIGFGIAVSLFAMQVGAMTAGRVRGSKDPAVRHLGAIGAGMFFVAVAQPALGFAAWMTGGGVTYRGEVQWWEALLATAHQTLGAVLLGLAVLTAAWMSQITRSTTSADK